MDKHAQHNTTLLAKLIELTTQYKDNDSLTKLGIRMADMKNSMGYPPDMFMERLNYLNLNQKLYIGNIYCGEMIKHKRASGAEDKAINRTRKHNQVILSRLMNTGEMGEY